MFDSDTLYKILLVSFCGGVISLDRTAVGQFMFSQPVVAGPLTGWILGDVTAGLVIGTILELIWLLDIPIGTFVPADSTVAVICATAAAVLGGRGRPELSLLGFSILLTIVLAPLTMAADNVIRKWNTRLADFVFSGPGRDVPTRLSRAHLAGIIVFFVKSFVLYLVCIPIGAAAVRWFAGVPETYHNAMTLYTKLLPFLGAASVVRKLSIKTLDGFLIIGFLTAAVLGLAFHAHYVVIVLSAVCAGILGVYYRERRS